MISYLGECLGGINGTDTQVRCLAHVQNLVVKVQYISPDVERSQMLIHST